MDSFSETFLDNMSYHGIQEFLPDTVPKSLGDYAIYNTFYPETPLTFKDQDVPNLYEDTHCPALSVDPNPDMEHIWAMAEQNYPEEYEGRRTLAFYQLWHDMEMTFGGSVNDEMDSDTEVHPKGVPRC
jgi:hypothetical protein